MMSVLLRVGPFFCEPFAGYRRAEAGGQKPFPMPIHRVLPNETWQSIADDFRVPVQQLLIANGSDPTNPPADPDAGSELVLPGPPPPYAVAPGNKNTIESRSRDLHSLKMQLYDDDGYVMTDVRYRVSFFGHTVRGTSPDGWVTITYPANTCASVELAWGNAPGAADYRYLTTLLTEHYQGEFVDKIAVSSGSGAPFGGS
jgi:hypothetical protein